jgi:preprotein translocase subunit SecG
MKYFLQILFLTIFVWMIIMTTRTSMEISVWDAWPSYKANPWAIATLWDAYFGFLTFFIWVCYKESNMGLRVLWFVLIMALGNIATSFYVLLQLHKLKPGEPVSTVLMA